MGPTVWPTSAVREDSRGDDSRAALLRRLFEKGDTRALDSALLAQRGCAAGAEGHETPADWYTCLRTILDGVVDLAEQQIEQNYRRTRETSSQALALYVTRLGMIRWMQNSCDGVEEGYLAARRAYPQEALWPAALAWLWLQQGRRASGEALARTLPAADDLPRDRYWLATVTTLAEIARHSGAREDIARLRTMLLPFADRLVPVGAGVPFWGTCARTLGLLEEQLELFDDAREHLELAVELTARVGAVAWHAEAQIELAEFALRHGLGDVPAYDLLAEARATARARGFSALARRARSRPQVRVLGRFEVISLAGTRARWSSRKARDLLKMLVAARGVATSREVFMDALWPGEAPAALANRFAVAVNVIRRALDPERLRPVQHHLVTEGDSVRLELAHLDIDLERFLRLAERDDDESRRAAARLYHGDAFSDEPYADWARHVREEARLLRALID